MLIHKASLSEICTETAGVVCQCGLRFCSQCLTEWHDTKTCDENMMDMHGQIDGLVLLCAFFISVILYCCTVLLDDLSIMYAHCTIYCV